MLNTREVIFKFDIHIQLLNTFPVLFGLKNVLSFFFIFQGLNEIKIENNT